MTIQIRDALSKFNFRFKRSLIDGLGSVIRIITGNLDQNDLKEINSNLDSLFKNQDKIVKQVDKFTSFANHITTRYINDMTVMQQNINTSLSGLANLNNKMEDQLLIHYNIFLAEKLLTTIQNIQRTVTLAFSNIANLEIISTSELIEIINHLRLIYKKDELIELDLIHLFKVMKFSQYKIISVGKIITCVLYIPILNPNPYTYQRIYPIPNSQGNILFPPKRFRLVGEKGETWTDELCHNIEKETICTSIPEKNKCLLNDMSTCNFITVVNNYKIIKQLFNNKILISTKYPLKIIEICGSKIEEKTVTQTTLISSKEKLCRLIINGENFENTFNNSTYIIPKIPKIKLEAKQTISFEEKHLDNFMDIKEEAENLQNHFQLSPVLHTVHISITAILIIICIFIIIIYVFRTNIKKRIKLLRRIKKEIKEDETTVPLQAIYPTLPTAPPTQNVDVLN